MSVYRKGSFWRYDFEFAGQRHVPPTGFTRRSDALEAQEDLKRTLRRRAAGLEAVDAEDTPRFSDWASVTFRWQRDRKKLKSPAAAKLNLRMILAFWGAKPRTKPVAGGQYRDLRLGHPIQRPELIEEFEQYMTKRKLSGPRKNHYRSACSMLYRVALYPEYRRRAGVRENPFAHVLRDRVRRRVAILEPEQLTTWLTSAPIPVVVAVALGTLSPALRLRNVVDLTRAQVAKDLSVLSVPHKTDRETGRPLVVPISPPLKEILEQLYKEFPKDTYVVPLEGERYWQLVKAIKRSLVAAGVPYGRKAENGVTFHSLRHTLQTWLARWGVSASQRQRALGHETAEMTAWYTHTSGEDSRPAIDLIGEKVGITAVVLGRLRGDSPTPSPTKPTDSGGT